jgi:hypothetical protein
LVEGCRFEVGEKLIVEEDQSIIDTYIESEDVSEEIVSNVAVRVRRKGGVRQEGGGGV